ncbi:YggS family pyridoxal phosphate-dependent enzyme [Robertkochia solimangrovi]|uniref:YggS family pyridoxal phosphate-dependent enzyme n=1 Tax=Robertkochia solimangrovi TaxID=2213046 RepID=UPI00117F4EC7|nr:YggS family pyridoxal phosphate-dependent enzyme [Robertkochia solimangrovi]TRZ45384.1 YggS family pyridoxal phosphate-dependent enzyme [Robertkochia solimangrovi]
MSIKENLNHIKSSLPENVTLVAVSKTKPDAAILEAYEAGQRIFGENKIQEMTTKWENLPKDIQWHMIGHVQRNKVKYMAPFVNLIHGIDSFRLLKEVDKQAQKHDRVIDCLLQIHIAREESKFGFDEAELMALLSGKEIKDLKHIRIVGLMGMATFTENKQTIIEEFTGLKVLFDRIAETYSDERIQMNTLSMGMSGDYKIAVAHGSNMVRIGSSIFGDRIYN